MNIPKILFKIRPGEEWTLDGDTYDGLVWLSQTIKPTFTELEAVWPEVQAEQLVTTKRQAYKTETDPIYAEWQALLSAGHPDAESRRLEWIAKRAEIAARFE